VPRGPACASSSSRLSTSQYRTMVSLTSRSGPNRTWKRIAAFFAGHWPRTGREADVPTTHSAYLVPSASTAQTALGLTLIRR
jgi:hypothetical protein